MAVTTTKPSKTPEAVPATEAELTAALAEARQAHHRAQRQADYGVSVLERLTARQQLDALGAAAEAAELALAQWKETAPVLERQRQAALLAEYDPEMKRRLAAVLPIVEEAERVMGELQRFAQQADHRVGALGNRYSGLVFSALVSDMHAESQLDRWRAYLRSGGWLTVTE